MRGGTHRHGNDPEVDRTFLSRAISCRPACGGKGRGGGFYLTRKDAKMGDQAKPQPTEKEIEFYLCSFVEMSGAPKAKLVPATHLEEMKAEGAGFAGFA